MKTDMHKHLGNEINELIINYLSNNSSEEELHMLKQLMSNDATSKQLFEEFKNIWISASTYQMESDTDDTQAAWLKIKDNLTKSNTETIHTVQKSIPLKKYMRIAATWLLLMSLGALSLRMYENKKSAPRFKKLCEITTPLGSKAHILLPDSSEVWLNAGTKLRYPESFTSDQRNVYLTGEAFFKVKSNKKWPFVVHATDVKIKALGTSFNVKAYPADKSIVATLVEGIIKVENENANKKAFTYTLKPNTKLTYLIPKIKLPGQKPNITLAEKTDTSKTGNSNIIISKNINTLLATSWKDPRWIIKGEKLDNLAILLERRYDVKINVLSGDLSGYKFSGIIENETLEQVLTYMKLATPIQFILKKGQVDLSINNNLKDNYTTYLKRTQPETN